MATPRLAESGSRRLSDSPSFSFKHSNADSPTRRVGESSTPRPAKLESQRLPYLPSRRVADSPSRGVVFRLRISPRIRSQKLTGSKDNVRDLWGPNFCKNPRKSASLACPFIRSFHVYDLEFPISDLKSPFPWPEFPCLWSGVFYFWSRIPCPDLNFHGSAMDVVPVFDLFFLSDNC